jgi:hypothetical protein
MTNWDSDGDGKVTLAEVLERRGDLFDGFDVDENGILSAEELADHNAMRDAMQTAQDRPDQAQFGMMGQGRGRQMGGQPGGGRMQAPQGYGYQQVQPGRGPMGGHHGGWGQPQGYGSGPCGSQQGWGQQQGWSQQQGMGPQGMGQQNMQQQMGFGLDTDGDGQISRDEFITSGESWLPRFDRNGDGVVDATDFPSMPQQ